MGNQSYRYRTVMVPVETRKFRRQRLKLEQGNNKIRSEWQRINGIRRLKGIKGKSVALLRKLIIRAFGSRGKARDRLMAKAEQKIQKERNKA